MYEDVQKLCLNTTLQNSTLYTYIRVYTSGKKTTLDYFYIINLK